MVSAEDTSNGRSVKAANAIPVCPGNAKGPNAKRQSMRSLGISSMYISCCFSSSPDRAITNISWRASVATGAVLGGPQLVHLGHALLELFVLALLVGMSLVLKAIKGTQLACVLQSALRGSYRCTVRGHGNRTSHFQGR